MPIKESIESSRSSKSASPPADVHLYVHGVTSHLNKKLLVAKSATLKVLLKDSQHDEEGEAFYSLPDIPGDSKTFELAARFCYGCEPKLSADNVVPLACLAYYLQMTETHSPNNLLNKTLCFLKQSVLHSWNESVKAFRSTEHVFKQAAQLGLIKPCLDSIVGKALADPRLLGQPILLPLGNPNHGDHNNNELGLIASRRRLFVLDDDCKSEDLIAMTLRLYEIIMSTMIQSGVPLEYVAGSLFRYAKKWASTTNNSENQWAVIEAVERLLPDERGLVPCKLLFELLRSAITFQASSDCRKGLEIRIGKQLDEATVKDLFIPWQGYATETQYDIDSVGRILKNFYANFTCAGDPSGLIKVAELMDEFLGEVANDVDLTKETFISLINISVATSLGMQRRSWDGLYRAIDVYLEKHSYLTESEREKVCGVLDFNKMSLAARQHAAQNKRLPLRVVVQVLFVGQLQLRDVIMSETQECDYRWPREEEDEEKMALLEGGGGEDDERIVLEMEEMDTRVMELEKECCRMRREIEKCGGRRALVKKEKGSMWKQLKRKLGCSSSMDDCDCHVKKKKKVHPRN